MVVSAGNAQVSVAAVIRGRWPHARVRAVSGTGLLAVELPASAVRSLTSVPGVRMVEPDLRTWSGPAPKPQPRPAALAGGLDASGRAHPASAAARSMRDGQQFVDQVAPDIRAARTALGVTGDADGDPDTYSTSDVVVVVVDSGIDDQQPALSSGKVLLHQDFVTWRSPSCGAAPASTGRWDEMGHGTHVAGIIAGVGAGADADTVAGSAGVAPGAALLDLKVFDCTGSGTMSDVNSALGWLLIHHAQYGVRVVNMSLGAAGVVADGTDSTSGSSTGSSRRGFR